MTELNIYVPRNKEDSKCWQVFNPFMLGWDDETHVEYDYVQHGGISMFWGLVGKNSEMIKKHEAEFRPYLFSDMPYFGRWSGLKEALDPDSDFYWRICPNRMHSHFQKTEAQTLSSDRFDRHNTPIKEKKKRGHEIILCPSSESVTRHLCNCSVETWINDTTAAIREYTDRPIRVRHKPRRNGTSGPAAALIPFAEDIKDAWCVITLISMSGTEALLNGVPMMETEHINGYSNFRFQPDKIESVEWSGYGTQVLMNWLAYQQFTPKEMYTGEALAILKETNPYFFSE